MTTAPPATATTHHAASRREFIKASAAAAGALLSSQPCEAADGVIQPAVVIDTHTHFYDPRRPQGVPWPNKNDKLLYRTVLPADLVAAAAPLRLAGTIVVEASAWVEDNQWVLDLAANEPLILGLVGRLTPGEADFAKQLARFAANRLFRGIRVNASQLKDGLSQKQFVADLASLADYDLEVDLNGGPTMPAEAARLSRLIPQLRIVVEHIANVEVDGHAPLADWLAGMQAAAEQPNVYCKVSALVEGASRNGRTAPGDVEFYRPVLDALWQAFGEDRLFYGSNWPVSAKHAGYDRVYSIVEQYFSAKGPAAQDKFFAKNSQQAYKWVARNS
jgi:L-fuconolactonase